MFAFWWVPDVIYRSQYWVWTGTDATWTPYFPWL